MTSLPIRSHENSWLELSPNADSDASWQSQRSTGVLRSQKGGCLTMVRVEGRGMPEGRDPAIKLFGRKIPLQEEQLTAEGGAVEDFAPAMEPLKEGEKDSSKENTTTETNQTLDAEPDSKQKELLGCSPSEISKEAEEPKPEHDNNRETGSTLAGEEKAAAAAAAAAALKKPDKVLQCPRCNSMDTKFCYYNNYNVNQPRHFCKNCQRYWTAGGTMRNVPVGAGRRKNKHASPAFRHMVVTPDTLASAQLDCPDPLMKTPLKANGGTILKFGPDAPLCESMTSVLNLGENREEPSCSSSVTASEVEQMGCQNEPQLQQCYPLPPPWAYAWNPMMAAPPPFCATPALPFPFIPASFWTCMPWSFPLMGTNNGSSCEPILGKHHRDSDASAAAEEEKVEKSLWVPKTLRIDDIDEAAKSSIFATLGIKPDGYKGFPSKPQKLLRANPAALSRSQSFQETTTT